MWKFEISYRAEGLRVIRNERIWHDGKILPEIEDITVTLMATELEAERLAIYLQIMQREQSRLQYLTENTLEREIH